MRFSWSLMGCLAAATFLSVGCAGPEEKLGRGLRNATEFARMGEIRHSVEQSALYQGNDQAYTTGFIRGINRSVARTAVGVYEIVTFPIPSYEPTIHPRSEYFTGMAVDPIYPVSYTPHTYGDATFETDAAIGFSGGDVAPFIPGSRFRIFDY